MPENEQHVGQLLKKPEKHGNNTPFTVCGEIFLRFVLLEERIDERLNKGTMKKIVFILALLGVVIGTSCSSTHETYRADVDDYRYNPTFRADDYDFLNHPGVPNNR